MTQKYFFRFIHLQITIALHNKIISNLTTMRLYLFIIICFLGSSLFNDRPLQNVREQMEDRNQAIQNVINQI